jgi:WD40 repeat protein
MTTTSATVAAPRVAPANRPSRATIANLPIHHRALFARNAAADDSDSSPSASARRRSSAKAAPRLAVVMTSPGTPTPRAAGPPAPVMNEYDSLYPVHDAPYGVLSPARQSLTPPVRRSLEADLGAEERGATTLADGASAAEARVNDVSYSGALPNLLDAEPHEPKSCKRHATGTIKAGVSRSAKQAHDADDAGDSIEPVDLRACAPVPSYFLVWVGTSDGTVIGRDSRTGAVVIPRAAASSRKNGAVNAMLTVERREQHGSGGDSGADSASQRKAAEAVESTAYEVWIVTASTRLIVMCGETGEIVATSSMTGGGLSLALSPCRRFVLVGGADGRLNGWSVESCQQMFSIRGHRQPLVSLCAFPSLLSATSGRPSPIDGTLAFASASNDGELLVWSLSGTAHVPYAVALEAPDAHEGHAILALAYVRRRHAATSPSAASPKKSPGKLAAAANANNKRQVSSSAGPTHFSDACLWAGGGDGTIRLWDATSLAPIATLSAHTTAVTSLLANDGEDKVWSASLDGQVLAWDARTLAVTCSLSQNQPVLAVTPVARNVVWRLWVCTAAGDGRVYLSATVMEHERGLLALDSEGSRRDTAADIPGDAAEAPSPSPRRSLMTFETAEELAKARDMLEQAERRNDVLENQLLRLRDEVAQLRAATTANQAAQLVEGVNTTPPSHLSAARRGRTSEVLDYTPDASRRSVGLTRRGADVDVADEGDMGDDGIFQPVAGRRSAGLVNSAAAAAAQQYRVAAFNAIEDAEADGRHALFIAFSSLMEALESAHEAVKVAITDSGSAKKQSIYWKDLVTNLQAHNDDLTGRLRAQESLSESAERSVTEQSATITQLREQIESLRRHFVGFVPGQGSIRVSPNPLPGSIPLLGTMSSSAPASAIATPSDRSPIQQPPLAVMSSSNSSPDIVPTVAGTAASAAPNAQSATALPPPANTAVPSLTESRHQEALAKLRQRHAEELAVHSAERGRENAAIRQVHEKELARLQTEVDQLRQKVVSLQQAHADSKLRQEQDELLRRVQGELEATQRKAVETSRERDRIQSELADVTQQFRNMRGDREATIDALRLEIASLNSMLETAHERHLESQRVLDSVVNSRKPSPERSSPTIDAMAEIATLKARNDQLQQQCDGMAALQAALRESQALESELQTEMASLNEIMLHMEQDTIALNALLEREREEHKTKSARLTQDLLAMKGPLQSMKKALQESHAALEEARADFVSQVANLEDTLDEREKELDVLRTQLERAQLRLQHPPHIVAALPLLERRTISPSLPYRHGIDVHSRDPSGSLGPGGHHDASQRSYRPSPDPIRGDGYEEMRHYARQGTSSANTASQRSSRNHSPTRQRPRVVTTIASEYGGDATTPSNNPPVPFNHRQLHSALDRMIQTHGAPPRAESEFSRPQRRAL